MLDEPLTHEEFGIVFAAGWRKNGGEVGPPIRLLFAHSDGRRVSWTRDEVRAEIARFRGVLASLPALLAVVEAACELEAEPSPEAFEALSDVLAALETPV